MTTSRPNLSFLRPVIFGAAAFFVALSAAWFAAARYTDKQLDAWIKLEAAQGHTITYADKKITGFPFRVELFLGHLVWDRLDGAGVSTSALLLSAWPWQWGSYAIHLPQGGDVSMRFPTLTAPFGLKAFDDTRGEAALDANGRLKSFFLAGEHLAAGVEHKTSFNTDAWQISLSDPDSPPRTDRDTGLIVALKADNLSLATDKVPLSRDLRFLSAKFHVTSIPPLVGDRLSVSVWNQNGGVVQLDDLSFIWGPLSIAMNGTLGLSPSLQPQAALTAMVTGFAKTTETLMQDKWITPEGRAKIETAAEAVAQKPDGSKVQGQVTDERIKIPLTLQDGKLMLENASLTSLPVLQWAKK